MYVRELGATSFTVIVIALVVVPPLFVAVTVYVPGVVIIVGVPEITPVDVFKLRSDGREGLTEYETTVPPEFEGELLGMGVPFV